jgi:hypothetical protein
MVHILGQKPPAGGNGGAGRGGIADALAEMASAMQAQIMNQAKVNPSSVNEWGSFYISAMAAEGKRREEGAEAIEDEAERSLFRSRAQGAVAAGIIDFVSQYAVSAAMRAAPMQAAQGVPIISKDDEAKNQMQMMYALAMVHAMANIACTMITSYYDRTRK